MLYATMLCLYDLGHRTRIWRVCSHYDLCKQHLGHLLNTPGRLDEGQSMLAAVTSGHAAPVPAPLGADMPSQSQRKRVEIARCESEQKEWPFATG
jgi:hypothetical protein